LLQAMELSKSFGGYTAVNKVSFSAKQGEVRAIIGPNGAGKTTLFNLLSGHLKPSGGRIRLNGEEISGKSPHRIARHGISRAFQTTNIFPSFTAFDNVLVSVLAHSSRHFQFWGRRNQAVVRHVNEILDMVHLGDFRDKLAGTLAHGDQRALEVAIALGSHPHVLLLDEPTAGMSPYETDNMIQLLRNVVSGSGLTVVLSEHDMDVVFGLAQFITVIDAGQVIANGTPEEIRVHPDVIRAYLGEAK